VRRTGTTIVPESLPRGRDGDVVELDIDGKQGITPARAGRSPWTWAAAAHCWNHSRAGGTEVVDDAGVEHW